MATIILSIAFFAIVMAVMAVGVIFQGKTIKGTCGGIGALGMGGACDICGGDTQRCEEESNSIQNRSSAKERDLDGHLIGAKRSSVTEQKADFYEA